MIALITPPDLHISQAQELNELLSSTKYLLHLRLPQATDEEYARFLDAIAPGLRRQVILCDHFHWAERYEIGGFYFSEKRLKETDLSAFAERYPLHSISIGVHSLNSLMNLPISPTYALLSPVFDSISKVGYHANADLRSCRKQLSMLPFPVLALGGVQGDNYAYCFELGYNGAALLGYIWNKDSTTEGRYRINTNKLLSLPVPEILSIAGHDPSGGAGVMADTHSAAQYGVRCWTIPSTLTLQTESSFVHSFGMDISYLQESIELILEEHPSIHVAKIGMVPSLPILFAVVQKLKSSGVKTIVWDPVTTISANDSQVLSDREKDQLLPQILHNIDLITPNRNECIFWLGGTETERLQQWANRYACNILLKGGHMENQEELSTDTLFQPDRLPISFSLPRQEGCIHGTGCRLSSSIASGLAIGLNLPAACKEAQISVARAIEQRNGKLAPISFLSGEKKKLLQYHTLQYITNTSDESLLKMRCTEALEGGIRWIQLRMKNVSTRERVHIGKQIVEQCKVYGAVCIIDDDVEAALRCKAHGVHIGITDTPLLQARELLGSDAIIGYTCHNKEELLLAHQGGADYVGIGPYRFTQTKEQLTSVLGLNGIEHLAAINSKSAYPLPIVAIGGITQSDFADLFSMGISGIALSGCIEQAINIKEHCRALTQAIKNLTNNTH